MTSKAPQIPPISTATAPRGRLLRVSTARADEHDHGDQEGIILTPEDEAELDRVIAETDEDERAGRCITWEQFLAERAIRRGR